MQLVSLEKECIGEPKSCSYQPTQSLIPIAAKNHPRVAITSAMLKNTPDVPEVISIIHLSNLLCKKYEVFDFLNVQFCFLIRTAIECRVIRKSNICKFANGKGKFFTFDVADLSSEIRCKAFNDITDMFYEMIAVDQVCSLNDSSLELEPNFIGLLSD